MPIFRSQLLSVKKFWFFSKKKFHVNFSTAVAFFQNLCRRSLKCIGIRTYPKSYVIALRTYIATRSSWRERFYVINPIGGRKDLHNYQILQPELEVNFHLILIFIYSKMSAKKDTNKPPQDLQPLQILVSTKDGLSLT